jgi:transposase
MPRPCSTDLRERALLACEPDEDDFTAVARRFRVGVSTLRLWRGQAARGGAARAAAGGARPCAPLDGGLVLLNQLVAERNDATLAEYADMLAARTGKPERSAPALCRALKRLGWVRKQRRCGPANRTVWTWQPVASRGEPRPPRSTRPGSSFSTRAAATRAWPGPTLARHGACAPTATRRADAGSG